MTANPVAEGRPTVVRRVLAVVAAGLGAVLVVAGLLGLPWARVGRRTLSFEDVRTALERLGYDDPLSFSGPTYGYLVGGAYAVAALSGVLLLLAPAVRRWARITAAVVSFVLAVLTVALTAAVLAGAGLGSAGEETVVVLSPFWLFAVLFVVVGVVHLGGSRRAVPLLAAGVLVGAAIVHALAVVDFFADLEEREQVAVLPTVAAPALGYLLGAAAALLVGLAPGRAARWAEDDDDLDLSELPDL